MATTDDLNSFEFIGMVGLCLYVPFLAIASIRTYFSLSDEGWQLTHKTVFHLSLCTYFLLDIIYLSDLRRTGTENTVAYGFHIVGLFFNLFAFATVILFWSKTLPFGKSNYPAVFVGVAVLLVINAISTLAFLVTAGMYTVYCTTTLCANMTDFEYFGDAFALSLLAIWLLGYGIRMQMKIGHNNNWTAAAVKRRLTMLFRINIVLLSCTFCYLARVFFISLLLYVSINNDANALNMLGVVGIYNFYWFLVTKWLVYLIPAIFLMHLMRPKVTSASLFLSSYVQRQSSRFGLSFTVNPSNNKTNNNNSGMVSGVTLTTLATPGSHDPNHPHNTNNHNDDNDDNDAVDEEEARAVGTALAEEQEDMQYRQSGNDGGRGGGGRGGGDDDDDEWGALDYEADEESFFRTRDSQQGQAGQAGGLRASTGNVVISPLRPPARN